jgi:hypothetical protein
MDLTRMIDKERAARIKSAIRDALMTYWDPIGVKDEPMAADEYDMYIGGLYELLTDKVPARTISDYLREIEIKRMGFSDEQVSDRMDVVAELKRISLD